MPMDEGVLQDDQAAFKWWTLAAEQGDASAQFNLGLMYATGRGRCAELHLCLYVVQYSRIIRG